MSQHSSSRVEPKGQLDHSQLIKSHSGSSNLQPPDGRQSLSSTASDLQLNQSLHESVCDEISLGSSCKYKHG